MVPWPEDEEKEPIPETVVQAIPVVPSAQLGSLIFGGSPAVVRSSNPFAPSAPISSNPFNPFAHPSLAKSTNSFDAPVPSIAPTPAPAVIENLSSSLAKVKLSPGPTPRYSGPTPSVTQWPATFPHFPAQFITTSYEAASSAPSTASQRSLPEEVESKHREGKGSGGRTKKASSSAVGAATGGDGWGKEGYEVQKVHGVDDVFLKFQERVARDGCGSQVIRSVPFYLFRYTIFSIDCTDTVLYIDTVTLPHPFLFPPTPPSTLLSSLVLSTPIRWKDAMTQIESHLVDRVVHLRRSSISLCPL